MPYSNKRRRVVGLISSASRELSSSFLREDAVEEPANDGADSSVVSSDTIGSRDGPIDGASAGIGITSTSGAKRTVSETKGSAESLVLDRSWSICLWTSLPEHKTM